MTAEHRANRSNIRVIMYRTVESQARCTGEVVFSGVTIGLCILCKFFRLLPCFDNLVVLHEMLNVSCEITTK